MEEKMDWEQSIKMEMFCMEEKYKKKKVVVKQ